MTAYTVYVDDNFHYQDEYERYQLGQFETYAEGLTACRRIVDDFLAAHHVPGMTAADLYQQYTAYGEDPWISPADTEPRFSAWTYAGERCQELCSDTA